MTADIIPFPGRKVPEDDLACYRVVFSDGLWHVYRISRCMLNADRDIISVRENEHVFSSAVEREARDKAFNLDQVAIIQYGYLLSQARSAAATLADPDVIAWGPKLPLDEPPGAA